jgi:ribosomal protein S1
MNITDFGAFIDLGISTNGLIHKSAMKGAKLKVSEKVECLVQLVDEERKRISLEFKGYVE